MGEQTFYCAYCAQPYECAMISDYVPAYLRKLYGEPSPRPKRMTCSDACRKRATAWNGWISKTRQQAISGDVNKPARLSSLSASGIEEATDRFKVAGADQLTLVA